MAVPATAYIPNSPQAHPLASTEIDQQKALHLTFALRGDDVGADEFTRELYDPASPNYHRWITPEQFGERFGASSEEIGVVERWAASHGLAIGYVSKGRRLICATGTISVAQKALSLSLGAYLRPGSKPSASGAVSADDVLFAPRSSPMLPSEVASVVSSIGGLTNDVRMRPMVHSIEPNASSPRLTPSVLSPTEIASVYDLGSVQSASGFGSGTQIGIYEPALYSSSDLSAYKAAYGITAPTPLVEYPSSVSRTTDKAALDVAEANLDIELINGLAPGAQVVLYEASKDTDGDVEAQFAQMADDALPVISSSWGGPEDDLASDSSYFDQINSSLQQMADEGTAFFNSSGDNGAYDNPKSKTPCVDFPGSSPYDTACGGTALPSVGSGYAWNQEIAWNDASGASGGGNSILFTRPAWQNDTIVGLINSNSNGDRQTPDVSSVAGSPGINIYSGGKFASYGGTSASAPVWSAASLMIGKLLGANLGLFSQTLYGLAANSTTYSSVFHDIVSGTNDLYSCGPGWDYPTGLGSVDYTKLYQALSTSASTGSPAYTFSAGLQMISSPYDYDGASLSALFSTAPKLAYWSPSSEMYDVTPASAADTLQPGYGYWANFTGATTLLADAGATAGNSVSVSMSAGWNMIGVPSARSVAVSALRVQTSSGNILTFANAASGNYVASQLYTYPAGATAYSVVASSGSLAPYAGYWLYATQSCTLIFP